jgi:uncharacterized protein
MLKPNQQSIIKAVAKRVRQKFNNEGTGHDWWHIERVWKTAKHISKKEGGDLFVIELAALLHDIADWKFHNGDGKAGSRVALQILSQHSTPGDTIQKVNYIIDNISYKLGTNQHKMQTIEGKIVQDADRIDALGAIGIARVFAYGGHKNRVIHDPRIKPITRRTAFQAKKNPNSGTSLNHFYEKLLLLKDKMNTRTGKQLAQERHEYLITYLNQFYKEWKAKYE